MDSMVGAPRSKEKSSGPVTINVPASEERRISDNFLLASFGAGSITYTPEYEQINYTTLRKDRRARSNFCTHNSIKVVGPKSPVSPILNWASHGSNTTMFFKNIDNFDYHATAIGTMKAAFGVNLKQYAIGGNGQAWINDAAMRTKPDLTQISVPNFLLDIGQLQDLLKLWKRQQSLARNVAGAHLNVSFGWAPTIGDIGSMISSVTDLQQALGKFNSSVGKTIKRRVTVYSNAESASGSIDTQSDGGFVHYRGRLVQKVDAFVVYRPKPLAVHDDLSLWLRGMLDLLGFELNPRIIWDKIPFSFIVDWFFQVGRYLEKFKVDTLELPIEYVDSYLQYSEHGYYQSELRHSLSGDKTFSGAYGDWETNEKFFHRVPIFPDFSTLTGLGWKVPTLRQALLSLSLATVLSSKK